MSNPLPESLLPGLQPLQDIFAGFNVRMRGKGHRLRVGNFQRFYHQNARVGILL